LALEVRHPRDEAEIEADRIATAIVSGGAAAVSAPATENGVYRNGAAAGALMWLIGVEEMAAPAEAGGVVV
jgi:hypothetical protein